LVFDVNAQGDNLHLHNATVQINTSGAGSVTAAYLYQGSTAIMSASVTAIANTTGQYQAVFNNIPDGTAGATIPINTTVPFTVKVDVSGLTAASSQQTISASTTSSMTIYNSADSSVSLNNSTAQGNTQTVLGQGLSFSLSGTPTVTKSISSQNTNTGVATTTYTATFNIVAQAVGTSVTFGLPNAPQPSFGTSSTGSNLVQIYQNGAPVTIGGSNNLPGGNVIAAGLDGTAAASYSAPSNTTVNSNGTFVLGINQSVTIPVTYSWNVVSASNNVYALQVQGIATSAGTSTFMANQVQWRTSSI
jgi:hypothetical protein